MGDLSEGSRDGIQQVGHIVKRWVARVEPVNPPQPDQPLRCPDQRKLDCPRAALLSATNQGADHSQRRKPSRAVIQSLRRQRAWLKLHRGLQRLPFGDVSSYSGAAPSGRRPPDSLR